MNNLFLLATVAIFLNILAHYFLVRFFAWYSQDSRVNKTGKPLKVKYLTYFLLIPPLAVVVAVLLVGLGLTLQIFEKMRKK